MTILLLTLIMAVLISGCKIEGGGSGSGPVSGSYISESEQSVTYAHTTPEPATLALFGAGLVGLAAILLRKKRRN